VIEGRASPRLFWWAAFAFALIAAAGLLGLDGVVLRWTAALPDDNTLWDRGTDLLDLVTLKGMSTFLLGLLLLAAAGLLLAIRATRAVGWLVLYVGAVQFVTATVADLAKPPFGRLRPFQALARTGGIDTWFAGADSFPSGHAGFYAGLFFPLMLLVPRLTPLWAIVPLFIVFARMFDHVHYLSDVSASLALAAAFTAAFSALAVTGSPTPARTQ
jgi:membrane-associated phospholipid phosphatase